MDFVITPPLLREGSPLSKEDQKSLLAIYEEQGTATWERVAGDDPLDERRLKRVSCTYDELTAQPDKIRETLSVEREAIRAAAKQVCQRKIDHIYMVGCGDSIAALRGTRTFLEHILGIPCEEAEALDFAYYNSYPVNENTLVVVLSSSGETIRVIEALLVARAKGAQTLALSNSPQSALMREASARMLIHASRKGWPTQSSTSAMAMMIQLGLDMAPYMGCPAEKVAQYQQEFDSIPALMEEVIHSCEEKVKELAAKLCDKPMYLFTAGGPHYTCAEFGSAKVKESTPNYAMAIPLEEYHHYNSQKENDPLFIIAPPGPTTNRALDTIWAGKSLGGEMYVLTAKSESALIREATDCILLPEAPEYFSNFLYAVPVQMFGYYLSMEQVRIARARLEGSAK